MASMVVVRASYDYDSKVWYVASSDLFGVHAEGATLDELRDKLPNVVRDMVEANEGGVTGDILIEIIAHASTRVAA
jgi:predicted RNase H-like HicB family nuclease